ncbi:chemotaxis protein CheW [Heyndrickxia acidiproducens]|uniref:chemotaxis protein CheW n=1 Tax=Heyndrickxia acidiproducens TaxID=1121084 RepID=UPI00035C4ED4|nr:chemotaxis protein CheW [Heyndrickxia acidiproducens]
MEIQDKYMIFKVRDEEYGISIRSVSSIEKAEKMNPIPKLPDFVRGVVKVRDELVPVIDIEAVFYQTQLELADSARLIVLQTPALFVGLLVKEANDILEIRDGAKKQVGLIGYERTKYFSSVANLDGRLITLVDPDILIASLEGIKDIIAYINGERTKRTALGS